MNRQDDHPQRTVKQNIFNHKAHKHRKGNVQFTERGGLNLLTFSHYNVRQTCVEVSYPNGTLKLEGAEAGDFLSLVGDFRTRDF